MDSQYNNWFSSCFGYDVILAYLGENLRPVLFPAVTTDPSKGTWLWNISSNIPIIGSSKDVKEQITFADCAPYLVVSETSLQNVSARLPDGEEMDISKFRPNIIVEGAESAWKKTFGAWFGWVMLKSIFYKTVFVVRASTLTMLRETWNRRGWHSVEEATEG